MTLDLIYDSTDSYFLNKPSPKKYINKFESLKSLLNVQLNQSQSIRLGTTIENILRNYIKSNSDWIDIKECNHWGLKERDHLFKRCGDVIYAELKSNLQLDSEKKAGTLAKILQIAQVENTRGILVALRHFSQDTLRISNHPDYYERSGVSVLPVKDYLAKYGLQPFSSSEEYIAWLNFVAHRTIQEDELNA